MQNLAWLIGPHFERMLHCFACFVSMQLCTSLDETTQCENASTTCSCCCELTSIVALQVYPADCRDSAECKLNMEYLEHLL